MPAGTTIGSFFFYRCPHRTPGRGGLICNYFGLPHWLKNRRVTRRGLIFIFVSAAAVVMLLVPYNTQQSSSRRALNAAPIKQQAEAKAKSLNHFGGANKNRDHLCP